MKLFKSKIFILFLILLLTTIPYTFWKIKDTANGKDNIAFSSINDDSYYNKEEIKKIIKKNYDIHKANSIQSSNAQYMFYESEATKFSTNTKYQYNENSLISCYKIDTHEMRFIWEYSEDNAQALLQSSIKQLSLIKLYDNSELYTYSNWNCDDSEYIDVFWVEDNYSFIANIPKKIIINNRELVFEFCKGKKEQFE